MNDYQGFHPTANWKIPSVDINDPKKFSEYIKSRTPCLVQVNQGVSLEQVVKECGQETVMVEQKKNGRFGYGIKKEMKFKEFYQALLAGDENLYLTTQYEIEDVDEERAAFRHFAAPPLHAAPQLVPRIWEKLDLIPHQVNMWVGACKDQKGTHSGLHHDHHDNIYILSKGRKKFSIFSPKDMAHMALAGRVRKVHPNGLIEYADGPAVREDGAFMEDVAQYRVDLANAKLEQDQSPEEMEKAEQELDQAMELLLEYQTDMDEPMDEPKPEELPLSFSTLDLAQVKQGTRIDIELEAGQALYLPCGWFHHVTSYGDVDGIHQALNFWFVPPCTTDFPYPDDFWRDNWEQVKQYLD